MEYQDSFRLQVIEKAKEWNNVTKAANEFGVTRHSVYKWMREEEDIAARAERELKLAEKSEQIIQKMEKVLPDNIEEADRYLEILNRYGTATERKTKLNARVETLLWRVLQMLETHEDLPDVHPKDLSKIMTDLESVREKLAGEPTIIIQERNKIKEIVFIAIRDELGEEAVPRVARRLEAMQQAEQSPKALTS